MIDLLSVDEVRSLGGIGEGVVEGIEGAVRRDRELEAIADPSVLDRTVSAFSSGCQNNSTWMPPLSRAASSRLRRTAGLISPPSSPGP
jgi:hypothetical protein